MMLKLISEAISNFTGYLVLFIFCLLSFNANGITLEENMITNKDMHEARSLRDNTEAPSSIIGGLAKKALESGREIFGDFEKAANYCFLIRSPDDQNSCLSGVLLANNNINLARTYCFKIKQEDEIRSCLSGIEMAKGNFSAAKTYCFSIRDSDGRFSCLSGVELATGNLSHGESLCFSIKSQDGRNGCLSGVYSFKEDLVKVKNYCFAIKNPDSKNACLSGLIIEEILLSL